MAPAKNGHHVQQDSSLRIAITAAISGAVIAGSAFADSTKGGKPETQKASPGQLVDALHAAFGEHRSRAVHAKGIILEGSFVPSQTRFVDEGISPAKNHKQGDGALLGFYRDPNHS